MTNLESIPLGIYEKGIPLALPWKEKFQIVKKTGFDYIELSIDGHSPRLQRLAWTDQDCAELKALTRQFQMPFRTMALSASRFFPLGDPLLSDQGIDIIKKAVQLAARLDIPVIQLAPYDVYQKLSTPETRARFTAALLNVLDFARKYSIVLAMEVLEDVPNFCRIGQCTDYIRELRHPQLKLYADTGNLAYNGYDAAEELTYAHGEIIACHLKDAVFHNEHNVPFGSGLVDFNRCLHYFKHIPYEGTFTAEVWYEEDMSFIPQLSSIHRFLAAKIMEENRK